MSDTRDPRDGMRGAGQPAPSIHVESWQQFRDTSADDVPMLVSGLVPAASLGFLSSPPKSGKTWLSLALGISDATGRPYLGRFHVGEPAPVLYLALEGSRAGLRARVGALARGMRIDPDAGDLAQLHLAYRPRGLNLSDVAWAKELTERAEAVGAAIVIVDVLRRAANVRESGDGAADFAALMANLAGILDAGRGLLFCHQFNKGGDAARGRSNGERMAGSGALFAAADVAMHITQSDDNARSMLVAVDARDLRPPKPFGVTLGVEGEGPDGGFTYRDTAKLIAGESRPLIEVWAERINALYRGAEADGRNLTKTEAAASLNIGRTTTDFERAWKLAGDQRQTGGSI